MARGKLPQQTPTVSPELFFAINDLYLYLQGLDTDVASLESSLFAGNKDTALWTAAGNSLVITAIGADTLDFVGTPTAANVAITNAYTYQRLLEYLVTVASTTAVAGFYAPSLQWTLGSALAGCGGFHHTCRWGIATGADTATTRCFVGMAATSGAPLDTNPSTHVNRVGFGWDSGDPNIQLIRRGAGAGIKLDLGPEFPRPSAVRTSAYITELIAQKGPAQAIKYKITNLTTTAVAEGIVATALPATNILLGPRGYVSVGGTSSVIGFGLGACAVAVT